MSDRTWIVAANTKGAFGGVIFMYAFDKYEDAQNIYIKGYDEHRNFNWSITLVKKNDVKDAMYEMQHFEDE